MKPKIAVLVLGYKAKENVDDCFFNLLNQDYKNYEVWFADNNSNDGAVEYIKRNFSKVKVISFDKNYGYAGGNNRMLKMAFNKGAYFCMILNADIKVEKDLLTSVMATYERKKKLGTKVGLIQPVIMLFKKPELINTAGNIAHYLGFGYCGSYLSNKIPDKDSEIVSVSGTAMFVSKKYYEEVGLFDEDFFMYNEDQNYSWRGLMRGYKHFLSAKGRIWHKYEFSKNKNKWFHSEKNRIKMVLENYEKKTLFL
jgi:GT2 family glycosyltransferase